MLKESGSVDRLTDSSDIVKSKLYPAIIVTLELKNALILASGNRYFAIISLSLILKLDLDNLGVTSNISSLLLILLYYSVDYIFIVKHVCREIPEQWKNFATAININEDVLEDISDEETNNFQKFCRVIEE